MAHRDDDPRGPKRESSAMNSPATSISYISSDLPDTMTLREYGLRVAAQRSTGESRLGRALRGLRLGGGVLGPPTPPLACAAPPPPAPPLPLRRGARAAPPRPAAVIAAVPGPQPRRPTRRPAARSRRRRRP